jgi:hypothetical protein
MGRFLRLGAAALAALAFPAAGLAGDLTLHPSGFGQKSYAAWKAHEGQPDSVGNANQALYLQKGVPTAVVAAGVAVVRGLAGQPATALTGLSWEHRDDSHCGAGAPRWNVSVHSNVSGDFTVFLGCAAAAHSPGSQLGWTRDSYPGAVIQAAIFAQTGDTANNFVLRGLSILFDEGSDQGLPCPNAGVGCVFLDNVIVNDHCWTGAHDNGGKAPTEAQCTPATFASLGVPVVAVTADPGLLTELGNTFPNVAATDWVFYPHIVY